MDFDFQNITNETRYFNFTTSARSTRSFPLTTIDDSVAGFHIKFIFFCIGIYDSGRQLSCDRSNNFSLIIEDNDGRYNCTYACSKKEVSQSVANFICVIFIYFCACDVMVSLLILLMLTKSEFKPSHSAQKETLIMMTFSCQGYVLSY